MAAKVFSAVLENLEQALIIVMEQAKKTGFDYLALNRIELACEEIIVNIIHHAYPEPGGVFEIECGESAEKKGIRITISDYGIPFDPLSHIPPGTLNIPLEERKIGGLGIYLVCTVMDKLVYRREDNRNVLCMIKYLGTDSREKEEKQT